MSHEPIRIRRYPNRRFYDRSQRRYVTLGEIEELVRGGRTIEVEDSKSGEDITRQVLTQIMLERHPDKMEFFPAALLHGLLRANDLATEFWRAYLRQSLLTLEGLQRTVSPFGGPLPWFPTLIPGAMPTAAPTSPPPDALLEQLGALEDRIAKLEKITPTGASGTTPESPGADASASQGTGPLDGLEGRIRRLERRARK